MRSLLNYANFRNSLRKCDELPQVDLSLWKDYGPENHDYATPLYIKK